MRSISIMACALVLWGCDVVRPHAGIGIGTTIGNVHLGTGLSVDPLGLIRRVAPAPARMPAAAARRPVTRHLTPVREFIGPDGRLCRDFYENLVVGSRAVQSWGTACQQPDGEWVVVSG